MIQQQQQHSSLNDRLRILKHVETINKLCVSYSNKCYEVTKVQVSMILDSDQPLHLSGSVTYSYCSKLPDLLLPKV